jgi:hypothetical protein
MWRERWLGDNICVYYGTTEDTRIGLTLGRENTLYLGHWIIGLDFWR